jgi:hypothetical protein
MQTYSPRYILTFLVQIPRRRHIGTDCEMNPAKGTTTSIGLSEQQRAQTRNIEYM